jgi:hypothetical protein
MEFEKLTEEEQKLYSEIEYLIITWSNDGGKTAGSLTRELMDLIKKAQTPKGNVVVDWLMKEYERP